MMQELKTKAENIDCKECVQNIFLTCSLFYIIFVSKLRCISEDILVFHISC